MSLGPKPAQYSQYTPPDVQGLRGSNLGLLNGIMQGGVNSPQFKNLFGDLGVPQTGLQQQSLGGISQFLNQPAPEQRALDTSMPFLQNLLSNNPGQGVLSALKPQFEQNLALANQQGNRFGSGNEILRSRALNDYNLMAQNALQQGVNQQLQGTQALNMLSQSAGNNPFQRLAGAYGIGAQQAQQNDVGNARSLGALMQLLGVGQQTSLGGPIIQTRAASQGLGGLLAGLAGTGLGSFFGPLGASLGGQFGQWAGNNLFGNGGQPTSQPTYYGNGAGVFG